MEKVAFLPHGNGPLPSSRRPRRQPTRLSTVLLIYISLVLSVLLFTPRLLHPSNYGLHSIPVPLVQNFADPADGWKDDIWPIRAQTPWDISTDFPYPRTLQYVVTEGTWLRLDVHPKTGDVVFDMLGDVYCLPSSAYAHDRDEAFIDRARPILLGVPHDSDPHFSPEGDRLVFRSDAGLGIENIWVIPWSSCDAMDLRGATDVADELREAMNVKEVEDDMLAKGVKETEERRRRRLVREGRINAQRVTNETYRWVTDARFHPSGEYVIATKWYTSSRSLGAGEGWSYPVPSLSDADNRVDVGSGKRIVGRTLPPGWGSNRYGDQQIGPEQFVWRGNDTVLYSKNVVDRYGSFTYSKDVHKGIYAIFSRNLTTGETDTVVGAFPGGASRPELSRDGRTLAFVRRVRDKEALVLKDLETGTIHHVWYGLTYDLSAVSAPMGTYPSFAFTPSDSAIIIWAAGKIWEISLSTNSLGERLADPKKQPRTINFWATVEKRLAETRRGNAGKEILEVETGEEERIYAFKELDVDESGQQVVFQAAGRNYHFSVASGKTRPIPTLHDHKAYFAPSFVPGHPQLVIQARWDDEEFTTLEGVNLASDAVVGLQGLPKGRWRAPSVGGHLLALVKAEGDLLTGDIEATAAPGIYVGRLNPRKPGEDDMTLTELRRVYADVWAEDVNKLRWLDNQKLLVQQSMDAFVLDIESGNTTTIAEARMSSEVSVYGGTKEAAKIAFVESYNVFVGNGSDVKDGKTLWAKPGNATKGVARVSLDGGHDVTWSRDGSKVFWLLGPYLHYLNVSKLSECKSAIEQDTDTFGIGCTHKLVDYQELAVSHRTAAAQLTREAFAQASADNVNADVLVITNATVLTFETEALGTDLIQDAVLMTRRGVIEKVGFVADIAVPSGATVINAEGGFVVPGFIDVHAHWNGYDSAFPAKSWEHETFLAYGVTTLHNPSADNVDAWVERSRIERGQLVGPRIFQTGTIIYGAGGIPYHQDIVDMDEARSALLRIKVEGGPASLSYKNYNLPSRASRQRLLLASRNLSMLCVPEGGMNQDWDLTYIIDGMTTVEHPLPIPKLYEDVLILYALSGTGATPTHVVNYGGAWGEQLVWSHIDVPFDDKLRRFVSHDILEYVSESTARPRDSWQLFNTSESIARMVALGLRTHIGAHGEPPLGLNYHAEMYFTQRGGLTNYEVLKAATSSAAITLGLHDALGTITPGKLADFVVYPPGIDLLSDPIVVTKDIRYVSRGGRLWDAETMVEVWPVKGRKQQGPRINAD